MQRVKAIMNADVSKSYIDWISGYTRLWSGVSNVPCFGREWKKSHSQTVSLNYQSAFSIRGFASYGCG